MTVTLLALVAFVGIPALSASDSPLETPLAESCAAPASQLFADVESTELEDLDGVGTPEAAAMAECDPNGCCVSTFYRTVNHNCGSCTRVWGTGGLQEKQKRTYNTCSGWSSWSTYESTCYPC